MVDSVDYSGIDRIGERVDKLCTYLADEAEPFVLPVANSIIYAKQATCSLHLIDSGHRLNSFSENVNRLFESYLTRHFATYLFVHVNN